MPKSVRLSLGSTALYVIFEEKSKMVIFRIFQKFHVILGFLLLKCCRSKSLISQLSLEKKLISYLNQIKSYANLKFGRGTVRDVTGARSHPTSSLPPGTGPRLRPQDKIYSRNIQKQFEKFMKNHIFQSLSLTIAKGTKYVI